MKNLKDYNQFNEGLKSNLAKIALGASLSFNNLNATNVDIKSDVDKTEEISDIRISKSKDKKLSSIISKIESNLKSEDSAKFNELFNELNSHIKERYNYKIKEQSIESINMDFTTMSLFEIMGWIGSILLAICGIPQAIMSFKDKNSDGISWAFLLLWAFGEIFALAYVYDKLDIPLLLNYSVNMLTLAVILYYRICPTREKSLDS